jgi:F-type H+-transporting ATPase subunit gamma
VASAELRLIRRRIKSVQSTMKITRAMELIATSRIAKARVRVQQAQPYTEKMTDVIRNIGAASGSLSHPLLEVREVKTAGVVVVTSDRGLAGGYNSNVLRLAERAIAKHKAAGREVRLYNVGDKAIGYFGYRKVASANDWTGVTDTPAYGDARTVTNRLLEDYESGVLDSVEAYTTRYVSALVQDAVLWPVLPVQAPEITEEAAEGGTSYEYEPDAETILGRLLPRYVEGTIFGILLEASASEHAARRRAMKAATENAEELVRLLSREANQARQAEITTEISEIVGGAEAMSGG